MERTNPLTRPSPPMGAREAAREDARPTDKLGTRNSHVLGRADLPVGPDARQRVPTAVQVFNARTFVSRNSFKSIEVPKSEAATAAVTGEHEPDGMVREAPRE